MSKSHAGKCATALSNWPCSKRWHLLDQIIRKTTRYLEKRGLIRRDEEDFLQINLNEDDALAKLQAGAVTYRFSLGPNKGKKALTLKMVDEDHTASKGLVANTSGFSLHAGVAFNGNERDKIEKLCRYIARPAVSLERLSLNPAMARSFIASKNPMMTGQPTW